jgi:hypothetical protein
LIRKLSLFDRVNFSKKILIGKKKIDKENFTFDREIVSLIRKLSLFDREDFS